MTTKLTLSINEEIVKKAKRISQIRGKSVSKIVEEYINSLPEKEPKKTASIRQISNKLKEGVSIPEDINYKQFIRDNRYQDYEAKHKK
jgi:flagellar biosynthesis chaperone FliJ